MFKDLSIILFSYINEDEEESMYNIGHIFYVNLKADQRIQILIMNSNRSTNVKKLINILDNKKSRQKVKLNSIYFLLHCGKKNSYMTFRR